MAMSEMVCKPFADEPSDAFIRLGSPMAVDAPSSRSGGAAAAPPPPLPVAPGDYRDKLGDPGPLGLLAFGMTTLLFNLSNAGLFEMSTATAGMVFCYGGATQVLCGVMEFVRGNTFGCTISTTYGAFWLATAVAWLLPTRSEAAPGLALVGPEMNYLGGFFFMWAIFALTMFLSGLHQPLAFVFVFFAAFLNFSLQTISFWSGNTSVMRVAGFEGIVLGSSAIYCGLALTMNGNYGFTVLPLLPHRRGRIISVW